jgi:hypothetical protein
MLQLLHFDVVKVDQGDVTSVSDACCKYLFKCFICFQTYVAIAFYLDIAYVLHICCNSSSKIFQPFQSYVAASGIMLQVASVIFWMFHVFHTHVASVCFKCFIYFYMYVVFKKNFMMQVFYVV